MIQHNRSQKIILPSSSDDFRQAGRQARGAETNNKMQKRKIRETWV